MDGSVAREGSTGSALLWMVGLSMALFWVPVAGPVLAGYVGGLKAGVSALPSWPPSSRRSWSPPWSFWSAPPLRCPWSVP